MPSDTPALPFADTSELKTTDKPLKNDVINTGEFIKFRVTYLGFTAGYITVTTHKATLSDRPIYKLKMRAWTVGLPEWLYGIRSRAISSMDANQLHSWGFDYIFSADEELDTDLVRYHQSKNYWIHNNNTKKEMRDRTQDVLSGIFYLRTLKLEPGSVHRIPVNVGKTNYLSILKVDKSEKISTKLGLKDAYRITPTISSDTKLKKAKENLKSNPSTGVHIWLSKGPRKIPLKISIPATFGTMYGYIEDYKKGNTD